VTNLRARAFLPVIFLQLVFILTTAQHAFSQETQTVAPRPAQDLTVAAKEKADAKDEACEQSTAVGATTATQLSIVEQPGTGKRALFSSQPAAGSAASREFKIGASRPFASDAVSESSLRSFDNLARSGGQQTTAATHTPLTSEQKMRRAFRSAFFTAEAYAVPLLSAIITEAGEDDLPHKDTDDRVADGLSRFAIHFGRRSTAVILSNGVYASLFKQDPRYERADPNKGFGARALHAASRVFITRGDDDGRHQPNYSRFAGQLSASALSNLWEQNTPGHDRIGVAPTFRRFGTSFITGAALNVIREFLLKK
jgi:hypothetical protein